METKTKTSGPFPGGFILTHTQLERKSQPEKKGVFKDTHTQIHTETSLIFSKPPQKWFWCSGGHESPPQRVTERPLMREYFFQVGLKGSKGQGWANWGTYKHTPACGHVPNLGTPEQPHAL